MIFSFTRILRSSLLFVILFFALPPIPVSAQDGCTAHYGTMTADYGPICLHNGEALLTATMEGDAVIPPGFTIVYLLSRTNGLILEQMGPTPNFSVNTVDIWRFHSLVYNPATFDPGVMLQMGTTTAYNLWSQLIQSGGSICASLSINGAPVKSVECEEPCSAFASSMTIDSTTVCLVGGQATLTATPSGTGNVPAGYDTRYVLTRTNGLIIEQVSTTPTFTVQGTDVWRIHNLVYDPATLDLGSITLGVTSAYDVWSTLLQGGGSICASLDLNGAFVKTGECTPSCVAEAGVVSADQADVCLTEGSALLSATPDGNATIPDGYQLIYLLTDESGIQLILAYAAAPEFNVGAAGQYGIHAFVHDPATFDLSTLVPGTTLMDLNAQLLQGGGGICASLDLDGADFQVVDCSPSCLADAGSMNSETEVPCLGEGSATISALSNGDTLVPPGFVMGYWLSQGSGLVLVSMNSSPEFSVSDTGLYHIHAFVYDPSTWDVSMVQLGETTGYELNLTLTQAGGSICASFDLLGATIQVNACPPSCTAGSNTSISLCANSIPINLFNALDGEPCPNGSWTAPNDTPFSGIFNPATDAAGVYTYTVEAPFNAPSTATVIVNVVTAPNPGTSTALALCSSDGIVNLLDVLGPTTDPSGTWMRGGTPFSGLFVPATMGSGVYTYTVTGTPPCMNATSNVTVTVNLAPDAGDDGAVTACINGPAISLFSALNGTPDMGGTWSGPGTVDNGVFIPGNMDAGTYTYTVLGMAPCHSDSAMVTVYVLECPDEFTAGPNGNDGEEVSTVVDETSAGQPIGIWPNPATDAVNVVLPFAYAGISRLELIDATGRSVQAVPMAPSASGFSLDVRSLPPGVWTLRITAPGQVSVGRFVRSAR